MLRYKSGDIWQTSCKWIVVPVNCMGVMGAGLAKQAEKLFPVQSKNYKLACSECVVHPGNFVYEEPLIFLPTKKHWRNPSQLGWVREGLEALRGSVVCQEQPYESIAIPALGCGLGGLAWPTVRPLIAKFMSDLPIDVEVYQP